MSLGRKPTKWLDVVWFTVCLVGSSWWCYTVAHRIGATFDEPVYMEHGLEFWRTGSHDGLLRLGTMPLPPDLQTLPIYVWERIRGEAFQLPADLPLILPWARTATLLFWCLLLTYVWRTGRLLAGPWGGRLAMAWVACEPNLLAHASLATTDIAFSACILAYLYHFRTGREGGWITRIGVPAMWCTLAILAKASAVVYGPVCVIVLEIERRWNGEALRNALQQGWAAWRRRVDEMRQVFAPFVRDFAQIALLSTIGIFLYCGTDWRTEASFVEWAHGLSAGPARTAMVWVSEHLTIFSNAGEAIVRQIKHNLNGHAMYLCGRADPNGSVWYYFPLLLTIKLTLPLLIGLLATAFFVRHAAGNWPLGLGVALLAMSINFRVQIGIRLILPLVTFLMLGMAIGFARLLQNSTSTWRKNVAIYGQALLLTWAVAIGVTTWPHGLSYVNEMWGGPASGYRYVSDSNFDWGQGVPDLLQWQESIGQSELAVWYFGTDPRIQQPPFRVIPFHLEHSESPADIIDEVPGKYVAVSATLAYGAYLHQENARSQQVATDFFRARKPAARVGTFLIYDLSDEPAWQLAREADTSMTRR